MRIGTNKIKRTRHFYSPLAVALVVVMALFASTLSYGASSDAARELTPLERHIRHEIVTLPFYNVFDNLTFQVNGSTVILMGQTTRPSLKKSAENVVARLDGVTKVDNRIEVLPVSANDDRIRSAVFRTIYYNPNFTKYAIRAVPPIHIIVKNGDVTLEGVVSGKADKNLAAMLARGVAGVFSVTNNLRVEE